MQASFGSGFQKRQPAEASAQGQKEPRLLLLPISFPHLASRQWSGELLHPAINPGGPPKRVLEPDAFAERGRIILPYPLERSSRRLLW
jgi:hypothetical protein